MNLNLVFAKSVNLNLIVLIKHLMNLIFSSQNLHCERSDLQTGQKESDQTQLIGQNLFVCFYFVFFSFIYLFFLTKNYEFVHVVLSYMLT